MRENDQPELLFGERTNPKDPEWFVAFLEGRDWLTAGEILRELRQPANENMKRKLRALADKSGGRICGHQKGYKLVLSMTREEYQWWRNEALKASAAIKARVIESDRVFYGRQAA
jgi:hypothetical protein